MVDVILDAVKAVFLELLGFLTAPFVDLAPLLFEFLFGLGNAGLAGALENPIFAAISQVVTRFAWVVFVVSLVFYLLKIVQEENRNWGVIFRCFLNTFLFLMFNQLMAKVCFYLPALMVSGFSYLVGQNSFPDIKDSVLGGIIGINGFVGNVMLFVIIVALLAFGVVSLMRVGAMFLQILIAPFYVPSFLMGDSQKSAEWILGTIAAGFTYVVQYVLFYTGLMVFRYNGNNFINMAIGFSCLLGTFAVPKQMQRFGWSSGAAHTFQSMSSSMGMLLMNVARKGV